MTKAQQIYERINALVADGVAKADAFRQLADEYGQPVKARAAGQQGVAGEDVLPAAE